MVAQTGTTTWPVTMMEKYMATLSHSSYKLFRTGESLRTGGEFFLRVLLLAKTEQLVMDAKLFGMHSLPAGGATANSGGLTDCSNTWVLEV